MWAALRRYFLTGIVAILPVGVTIWVLVRVFVTVDGNVSPWLAHWIGFRIPGLGFLVTVLFVLLTGIFASNLIGRQVITRFEKLFGRLPLISKIYTSVKQIGDGILGSQKSLFEQAVMFEYPRRGCWAIGFVTSRHEGFVVEHTGRPHFHVFVPTTPNPTSGFLLFIPEDEIIPLDITVEEGLKLVISGGAVTPPGGGGRISTKGVGSSDSGKLAVPEG